MPENFTMHVLCWSHLDREWNLPFETTRADMVQLMDELLDLLEKRRDYRFFHLDGQVVPLEDYLEYRPEHRARIRKLVKSGRLLIGPWYTLPEMNVIQGECIARNLLRGRTAAGEFGNVMKVGFTNTGWGQVSQMPQILTQFGIDTYTSYRGVPTHQIDKECLWEGPDGSRVILFRPSRGGRSVFLMKITTPATLYLRGTDGERKDPPPWPPAARAADADNPVLEPYFAEQDPERIRKDHIAARIAQIRETMEPDATTGHLWLGNWQDRRHVFPRLPDIVAEARKHLKKGDRLIISSLPAYVAAVKKERRNLRVQLRGEMRTPQKTKDEAELMNVLPVRSHLKTANRRAEHALIYGAESWAALASVTGFRYPKAELDLAWKLLMLNHCHDTIGGVGVDRIHEDQMNRFARVIDLAADVGRRSRFHLARRVGFRPAADGQSCLVAFNGLPGTRSAVVECALDVPFGAPGGRVRVEDAAGGEVPCEILSVRDEKSKVYVPFDCYKTWSFRRVRARLILRDIPGVGYAAFTVTPCPTAAPLPKMDCGRNWMENECLRVQFNRDGTFDLVERKTRRAYKGLGWYEDGGNVGSGWDYTPPRRDRKITSRGKRARVRLVENGALRTTFRATVTMRVPAGSNADRTGRSRSMKPVRIVSVVSLDREGRCVRVITTVNNTVKDHRLRVMFPSVRRAKKSHAETPFDVVARPVGRRDTRGWEEQDDGGRPMLNFVDVADGKRGLAVITRGLCEYEALRDAPRTIAVTLLRGFTHRQFRWENVAAEGVPGTQMPGEHTFEYCLFPHAGTWERGKVARTAYEQNIPLMPVQTFGGNDGMRPVQGLLTVTSDTLILSALKQSEDGRSVIVRLSNPSRKTVGTDVESPLGIRTASLCTMAEERAASLRVIAKKRVRIEVGPKKVVTLRLNMANRK